ATTAPLPVELVAFAAQRQGETARLTWATASEKNSAWFEVQASADGASFRTIGQVAAAGSSLTRHDYAYLDANLPGYGAPQVYYRLRQVDLDGTSAYSPVRVVAAEGAGLAVYPNPAHTYLRVLRPAGAGTEAQLRNALGQVVRVLALPTAETPIDLSGLAPGVYVLTLPGAGLARRVVLE
ncbi:MAG: T9SS type A sorting domain-containing protein, partial [Hymenobacter sp.]